MTSIKDRVMKQLAEEKKKKEEQSSVKPPPLPVNVQLNNVALSTYFDKEAHQWYLVKIKYDAKSNTVGKLELKEAEDKSTAIELFKLAAVDSELV